MLSPSDGAITHALANVRYQQLPWLCHQTIESKVYDNVLSQVLSLCHDNGIDLEKDDFLERASREYFESHAFFRFIFRSQKDPITLPAITTEVLRQLRFIEGSYGSISSLENRARSILLSAKEETPCYLHATLIPFGGRASTRPNAVFCLEACMSNCPDLLGMVCFPLFEESS